VNICSVTMPSALKGRGCQCSRRAGPRVSTFRIRSLPCLNRLPAYLGKYVSSTSWILLKCTCTGLRWCQILWSQRRQLWMARKEVSLAGTDIVERVNVCIAMPSKEKAKQRSEAASLTRPGCATSPQCSRPVSPVRFDGPGFLEPDRLGICQVRPHKLTSYLTGLRICR